MSKSLNTSEVPPKKPRHAGWVASVTAVWWKYDGTWMFGAPRVDHVKDEADLFENDDRRAAFLLYRRADFQD